MTFSDPLYLLLLIPAIAWAAWLSRKMHGIARPRRRTALTIRIVVIALLVCALAGLQTVRVNRGVATVFVLDRSASMDTAEERQSEQFISKSLEALGPSDQAGLVVFGKDPVIDTDTGSLRQLGRIYADPDRSSTDLSAAIRLASATLPEDRAKRLVLLTDGNETSGDAAQAAESAAADNIQIDAAPVSRQSASQRGEVLIDHIETPSESRKGEPFELRVVAQATQSADGVLHVDRDGAPVVSMPVHMTPGTNVIAVSQTGGEPGFYKYRATLDVDNDTDPRNNVGIGFVNVLGRPRILLVEGQKGSAAALETALKPHDLDVRRTSIEGLPTSAEELQSYDSVILSDYPADGLTDAQMAMIASGVQNSGMGFGMIGGENSFLPGGYYGTPIADILPVDLNVRQRKTYPSTCIEIVVDASGSMAMPEDGVEKIKIAGTAAAAVVRMMNSSDLVGVAGSTDAIEFVAPIQRAVDKDTIAAQCGKLDAGGGGIYIEPSLEFADRTLTPVDTKVKHLILESDGDDAEQQERSFDLARKMVASGMTISVIAIGNGKDVGFLRELAQIGKGYFYLASQAKMLQRMVTQDASVMARSAIEEGAFLPKVDPGDEVLRGIDLQTMPPLYAYDLTSDRALARTPMRTNKDDPLLAYWQYGLGTSMAFTSDAQPKWARQWMGWDGFNAFWAQAIRATVRQASSDRLQMNVRRDGGKGVLEVNALDADGNPLNGLKAKVSVIDPSGANLPVALEQTGPGRYGGSFDADRTGGYVVVASQTAQASGGKPMITRSGFSVAYPPEYQSIGTNTALLAEIARTTGGVLLDNPVQSFRPAIRPGRSIRDLWPDLLLAAALLFILDIAVRRLVLPLGEIYAGALVLTTALLRRRRAMIRPLAPQAQSIARLSNARSQVRDSGTVNGDDSPIISKGPSADTAQPLNNSTPQAKEPAAASPSKTGRPDPAGVSTTQRLLDIKRRQNGSNDR